MKEGSSTIAEIKAVFELRLKDLYAAEELKSLFFYALEALCHMRKVDFVLRGDQKLTTIEERHFNEMITRLEKEEPIQYILGTTTFYGREFDVSPDVLIPRPETEELVDWIIKDHKDNPHFRLMDIGTGSACIPVSLSCECKEAAIHALDVSAAALKIAKENAAKHHCKIQFIEADILKAVAGELPADLDIIVSNPPYVLYEEKALMKKNVLEYEPHLALFVDDNDPLLFYKRIAFLATSLLKVGGCLYFEINEQYGEASKEMLTSLGFEGLHLKKDLDGKERMLKAIWSGKKE